MEKVFTWESVRSVESVERWESLKMWSRSCGMAGSVGRCWWQCRWYGIIDRGYRTAFV